MQYITLNKVIPLYYLPWNRQIPQEVDYVTKVFMLNILYTFLVQIHMYEDAIDFSHLPVKQDIFLETRELVQNR